MPPAAAYLAPAHLVQAAWPLLGTCYCWQSYHAAHALSMRGPGNGAAGLRGSRVCMAEVSLCLLCAVRAQLRASVGAMRWPFLALRRARARMGAQWAAHVRREGGPESERLLSLERL